MTQLQQQFISVANEYARQFGKIIGYNKEFWSSIIDGHHACFGDNYFFSLEEMQLVVDYIDKWVRCYGSREKVGDAVTEWFDYFTDIDHFEKRCIDGHPSINLYSWLKGARPSLTNKTKKS